MNTTFPFYTSTAMQDANRNETPYVRTCPRHRLLPFQIERAHITNAVSSINLVDCAGIKTAIGTSYLESIGTTTGSSSVGIKFFTNHDYIIYGGGQLKSLLPLGVYYLELSDTIGTYYSEHFRVEDIQPELLTAYTSNTYDTFTTSGINITSAINASGDAIAFSNLLNFDINDKFEFKGYLTLDSGQAPSIYFVNNSGTLLSNPQTLIAGWNDITLTVDTLRSVKYLAVKNSSASDFSLSDVGLRKSSGDFIKLEFSNSSDLRHTNREQILYATGGFAQRVYLKTYMNNPENQTTEIGEEKIGIFNAEQVNTNNIYKIVDYISKSLFKGLQYMPMHDTITITDEVGNEYMPDIKNMDVAINWNTFNVGTLDITFNDGSMTWVNDSAPIT